MDEDGETIMVYILATIIAIIALGLGGVIGFYVGVRTSASVIKDALDEGRIISVSKKEAGK